jgi:ribosomal protein L24
MKNDRLVELAIEGLQEAKKRIDAELQELLGLVGVKVSTKASAVTVSAAQHQSGRKKRTAAQKKAHSERMKKIWAARKAKK